MSDIFGRSTSRPVSGITRRQITSMIRKYVTSGLNLVDVDSGEIVVFGDKEGKLKTSNLSLDDLLTKQPTADDDSIVVFKKGKLEPSYKITTITDKFDTIKNNEIMVKAAIDSITTLRTAYDTHIKTFGNFRNNIVEKFLGKDAKPKDVTPTLAEIKTIFANIENARKKLTDDIADIYSQLGVWVESNPITATIAIIKQDIKTITDKVKIDDLPKLDKIKIPHEAKNIKGISYVIRRGLDMEYLANDGQNLEITLTQSWYEIITGIYRVSVFSEHQFNVKVIILNRDKDEKTTSTGVNTALIALREPPPLVPLEDRSSIFVYNFIINVTPVDPTIVRAKYSFIVEYLSPI